MICFVDQPGLVAALGATRDSAMSSRHDGDARS